MSLIVETFILGSIDNNTYLLWDDISHQAVIIDPSFYPVTVLDAINKNRLSVSGIWLTHGHFDHFIGISEIHSKNDNKIPIYIHNEDLDMYLSGGLASQFVVGMPESPAPGGFLEDGQILTIGTSKLQVRHTPGHSAGHVVFYSEEIATVFTGDLIFKQSVGRTDLPGADQDLLLKSIYSQILTLPGETLLLSGHGEKTTVDEEIEYNPYLN
jgi:hydroxyacylglutathione hydrolase